MERKIKIALLDLNNGFENQGMRCIREITHAYFQKHSLPYEVEEFDVRQKNQVPNSSFDIYLSSGGPGSPFDEEGWEWEHKYFKLVNKIYQHNLDAAPEDKKFIFFICHSFQIACRIFHIGNVCERRSTSFGVFPMTKVEGGLEEPVFEKLDNPFYGVDSRDFQVIEPDHECLEELGAKILAIEKERPHVPLERAIMGIRFSPEMIGTQFHPEADAISMRKHLLEEDKKKQIIQLHGEDKYYDMIEQLEDPDKIMHTQAVILPTFLDIATANYSLFK